MSRDTTSINAAEGPISFVSLTLLALPGRPDVLVLDEERNSARLPTSGFPAGHSRRDSDEKSVALTSSSLGLAADRCESLRAALRAFTALLLQRRRSLLVVQSCFSEERIITLDCATAYSWAFNVTRNGFLSPSQINRQIYSYFPQRSSTFSPSPYTQCRCTAIPFNFLRISVLKLLLSRIKL